MSLDELWQLFPITLKANNPLYGKWYAQEKSELIGIIGRRTIKRISHIGSTAVHGLIAKPTIDILLEVDKDCDIENVKITLCSAGWLLMSEETKPDLKLTFNKGYTPAGFAEKVFHLHVRCLDDWDELYFRDYLNENKDVMIEYEKLKLKLQKQYEHNRDAYTNAKSDFIMGYSKKAKEKYKNRYLPIMNH